MKCNTPAATPQAPAWSRPSARNASQHGEQVALNLHVDLVEYLHRFFLARERRPDQLQQLAPEMVTGGKQEIGQQQHDRGLRGDCGQQGVLCEREVAQPGGLGCRRRRSACLGLGACISGGALDLLRCFLHVLQRAGRTRAGGAEVPAQFAGGLRQLFDQRVGIAADGNADPAEAADHHRQYQRGTDAAWHVVCLEPRHQRVQRVAG
jgi:hypothetical protein